MAVAFLRRSFTAKPSVAAISSRYLTSACISDPGWALSSRHSSPLLRFRPLVALTEFHRLPPTSIGLRCFATRQTVSSLNDINPYKIKELPRVRWVLPDSYLDVKNKDCGAVAHTGPFCSRNGRVTGEALPSQVTLYHSILHTQRYAFSSSASPQTSEKETNQAGEDHAATETNQAGEDHAATETNQAGEDRAATEENNNASKNRVAPETSDNKAPDKTEDAGSKSKLKPPTSQSVRRRRVTKRTAFSDSEKEDELSVDELVKLVVEKEELLKIKHKEMEEMQEKVLRTYAEMENILERTKREAENSKKFAIQNFAKSLLDVADNLERASLVVKDSFSKIDSSKDTVGAVPLLKTLLEGVEMTYKQLEEVFRKFGVEKYDPTDEPFDPNRHNAVFQIPDDSKPPGTVAAVLKPGYMLYERVLRPADVGVSTQAPENNKNEDN